MSDMSIGLSGLFAARTALDVAGQNITNANTPGYARREVNLSESTLNSYGGSLSVGGGVSVESVRRVKDMYLEGQVHDYNASLSASTTQSQFLDEVQGLLQEPSDQGMSTLIDKFFNQWQSVSANPEDPTGRSMLLDTASQLASRITGLRTDLLNVRNAVRQELGDCVNQANQITAELAQNNQLTINAQGGATAPLALEDQRDSLLAQLAALTGASNASPGELTAQAQVGGTLLVSGAGSLQLQAPQTNDAPVTAGSGAQASAVDITSGRMGALLKLNQTILPGYIQQLDQFAAGIIGIVNAQHAQGISQNGRFAEVSGTNVAGSGPLASALKGAAIAPTAGQLTINIVNEATGEQTVARIAVNPASQSLSDLAAAINGTGHLTATTAGGKLSIAAGSGYSFDFSADQGTNILAALGINSFFQGSSAADIRVADALVDHPELIAAGRSTDSGDGSNATAIANLSSLSSATGLSGKTPAGFWQSFVTGIGIDASNATQAQQTSQSMVDVLSQQEQSTSGISLDEEAAKVLQYQQMYDASARYLSTISRLTDILLQYTG